MIEHRDPRELKNHRLNIEIYGDKADPEFVEQVRKHGVAEPLRILPDGTIVSGHHRCQAAVIIGMESVPVVVEHGLTDELEIERQLLLANQYRNKTAKQKAREFENLRRIEAELAKRRRNAGLKQGRESPVQENFPERGQARDRAAEQLGMSGRTAEKALRVAREIDSAEQAGDKERADRLREKLDQSVDGAYREIRPPKPNKRSNGNGRTRKQGRGKPPIIEAIEAVEGALKRASRLTQRAQQIDGAPSEHSKAVVDGVTYINHKLSQWKRGRKRNRAESPPSSPCGEPSSSPDNPRGGAAGEPVPAAGDGEQGPESDGEDGQEPDPGDGEGFDTWADETVAQMLERVNGAWPADCNPSQAEWKRIAVVQDKIQRARTGRNRRMLEAAVEEYEQTAREIAHQRTQTMV